MNRSGITLIEVLIAVAMISIGFLGAVGALSGIHKSIQVSKSRMLATNIAQEKVQVLMQKSYYEVLVTTSVAYTVIGSSTISYDNGYFPPEVITEGGIEFTRYTYIQVAQENSGVIETLPPTTPDTGLRLITQTVKWSTSTGDRLLSIRNVLNNPNTVMSNAILSGVVRNANTLAAIPFAFVNANENVGWRDTATAAGAYSINLSAGYYAFQATAAGYFPKIMFLTIAPNVTTTQNFDMIPMSSGSVQGTVWGNTHLLVSQVVASTGPAGGHEYTELYNPTTGPITIGSGVSSTVNFYIFDYNNVTVPTGPFVPVTLTYISTFVPTNGHYLIANTPTLTVSGNTRTADAYYTSVTAPAHLIPQLDAGGLGIATAGPTRIDSMAWTSTAAGHTCPSTPVEGTCITTANGLQLGEEFIRRTSTASTITSNVGHAYDSENNTIDFFYNTSITRAARNTSDLNIPLTGTPWPGAIASVSDGLSVPAYSATVGSPPYAQFTVPAVATGTWTLFVDSTSASASYDNITIGAGGVTSVPNASTSPTWRASGFNTVVLSTSGNVGMISGRVTNAAGSPLSGIIVTAGSNSTTTSAAGTYIFRLSTGTYDVIANPGNANATYASQQQTSISVTLADMTSNINFSLSTGGSVIGWVSRDGTNALPGVTMVAFDSNGTPRDSEVTGSNGQFFLTNLTTGTYTIQPTLDTKETSSPSGSTVIVTAGATIWSTSFTVVGAMGNVTGSVTLSGSRISSGVLVVVSTGTFTPPTLSSATLSSTVYYSNSSREDGTYSVDVRGSTTTLYNAAAYYMYLNNQTPVISSRTVTGITVNGGMTTTGVNFAW